MQKTVQSISFRASTLSLTVAGFVALMLPLSAIAAPRSFSQPKANDYESCAGRLLGLGVSSEAAAAACARAQDPVDLAKCAERIQGEGVIEAEDALSGCRRVRRPADLASCVVTIGTGEGIAALDVLDNCRRSLRPVQFSDCVVGLQQEITLSTDEAMSTCIAADDRPEQVLPSFVPSRSGEDLPPQIEPQLDSGTEFSPIDAPTTVSPGALPATDPQPAPAPAPTPPESNPRGLN